jgi:hypothetical protein
VVKNVQRWQTNVYDEKQSGRPSVVRDDLVQSCDQKIVKDGTSQYQLLCEFPQISHTVLCEIFS